VSWNGPRPSPVFRPDLPDAEAGIAWADLLNYDVEDSYHQDCLPACQASHADAEYVLKFLVENSSSFASMYKDLLRCKIGEGWGLSPVENIELTFFLPGQPVDVSTRRPRWQPGLSREGRAGALPPNYTLPTVVIADSPSTVNAGVQLRTVVFTAAVLRIIYHTSMSAVAATIRYARQG
jgi:hypothetical protein